MRYGSYVRLPGAGQPAIGATTPMTDEPALGRQAVEAEQTPEFAGTDLRRMEFRSESGTVDEDCGSHFRASFQLDRLHRPGRREGRRALA